MVLPQLGLVNRIGGSWFNLETKVYNIVNNSANEVEYYIIAGGSGYDMTREESTPYPENHPFNDHPSPVPGVVKNFVARTQNPDIGEWEYTTDSEGRIVIDVQAASNPLLITNPKLIGVPDYTWKIMFLCNQGREYQTLRKIRELHL